MTCGFRAQALSQAPGTQSRSVSGPVYRDGRDRDSEARVERGTS
jgi:hypothetical protein